ncbi:MAG: hypothetical protein QJR08_05435 [Bacillota bacterium]|nr:hypothetical protein [Bacillota bacterium]
MTRQGARAARWDRGGARLARPGGRLLAVALALLAVLVLAALAALGPRLVRWAVAPAFGAEPLPAVAAAPAAPALPAAPRAGDPSVRLESAPPPRLALHPSTRGSGAGSPGGTPARPASREETEAPERDE